MWWVRSSWEEDLGISDMYQSLRTNLWQTLCFYQWHSRSSRGLCQKFHSRLIVPSFWSMSVIPLCSSSHHDLTAIMRLYEASDKDGCGFGRLCHEAFIDRVIWIEPSFLGICQCKMSEMKRLRGKFIQGCTCMQGLFSYLQLTMALIGIELKALMHLWSFDCFSHLGFALLLFRIFTD